MNLRPTVLQNEENIFKQFFLFQPLKLILHNYHRTNFPFLADYLYGRVEEFGFELKLRKKEFCSAITQTKV